MKVSYLKSKRKILGAFAMCVFAAACLSGCAKTLVTEEDTGNDFSQEKTDGLRDTLAIAPSVIRVSGVPVGERVALSEYGGQKLTVTNRSSSSHTFTVDIRGVKETNNRFYFGSVELPQGAEVKGEETEFNLNPRESRSIEIYVKLPGKEQYPGKRYQAVAEVKRKKASPRQLFEIAAQAYLFINTEDVK